MCKSWWLLTAFAREKLRGWCQCVRDPPKRGEILLDQIFGSVHEATPAWAQQCNSLCCLYYQLHATKSLVHLVPWAKWEIFFNSGMWEGQNATKRHWIALESVLWSEPFIYAHYIWYFLLRMERAYKKISSRVSWEEKDMKKSIECFFRSFGAAQPRVLCGFNAWSAKTGRMNTAWRPT